MPTLWSKIKSFGEESVPEEARRRIEENKRTKAKFLYLGSCGLTKVPAEVGELVWLESLSLSDDFSEWDGQDWKYEPTEKTKLTNKDLTDLSPLAGLTSLQALLVYSTQVSDLKPLAGLTSLQTLDVQHTPVHDLAPLAELSALGKLVVHNTLVSDLAPLAGLSALRALYVFNTQVRDLAPLAHLPALGKLVVYNTQVRDLKPLAGLTSLQTLGVSNTKVNDLSPLTEHMRRGVPVKRVGYGKGAIRVGDCPLTNPPPEIVEQGNEAILNYFREREVGGVDHLYEAKMLILGEGGAGKTSLLRRLYQPDKLLPTEDETTRGIAIYRHEFKLKNGRTFRLNVWDFGGQQIYHATHQFFLTHRSLYVLVDDTRKDSKSVTDEGFKYWFELIDVFSEHSPTLIFQNEKGGRSKQIDLTGIRARFSNVKEAYAGDLDKPGAADDVRDAIELFASQLSHIGEEVPARWIKVREEIEELAAKKPYISVEEYFEVYRKHIEFDETKAMHLSRYLHDLGVFLHFQDDLLLTRTIILQNQWATEAVFRILDDETVKKKFGRFDREDCQRLWTESKYARMHWELLALMKNFELCYELADRKPPTWLAPQLLPAQRPNSLAESGRPDDLVLRYRYEFLPKGMISRLTVRQHRFVRDPEKAWISGVLFERDSSSVLAEILPNSEIELRGRGPERKALLSVIAADLDALNDSFHGLREKVDKRIPCNCSKCSISPEPEFFDQKDLLSLKERGRFKWPCKRSFEDVDVQELLDGIKLAKPPDWAKEAAPSHSPRRLRVFLASSSELRDDRHEFDRCFRQRNDALINEGIYLTIVRWENFLDAMSETRLQDEYNKAVRDCDVFVSLFFTKAGKYTQEEFNVAYGQFKNTRKPLVYVFCKDAEIRLSSTRKEDLNSLWEFQAKVQQLGHFYTPYENIQDLKLRFRDQLDEILAKLQS